MSRNENRIDNKATAYINNLFSGVGASQQLFDLKEELAINIKEKTADYKTRGMDQDQAFKEAVISMGDLSGLVEDMRKLGQDTAKQSVYSTMAARISTVGIVTGVLLVLFGLFVSVIVSSDGAASGMGNYQDYSARDAAGTGIFVVAGGTLLTYSVLTRETSRKYGMNKIRAALYALSIGIGLFGMFVSALTYFEDSETYKAIASLMVFSLPSIGLFLFLILTGTDRRKNAK